MSGLQNARFYLALTIVSLYMLLEAAFMLVRIPPGSVAAVPTGEILIIIFALTLVLDRGNFGPFFRAIPLAPIAIWWSIGFTQLLWDPNRQAIQDRTAHTVVVDLRAARREPVPPAEAA